MGGGRHAWPSAAGGRGQLWLWVPGAAVLSLWDPSCRQAASRLDALVVEELAAHLQRWQPW